MHPYIAISCRRNASKRARPTLLTVAATDQTSAKMNVASMFSSSAASASSVAGSRPSLGRYSSNPQSSSRLRSH